MAASTSSPDPSDLEPDQPADVEASDDPSSEPADAGDDTATPSTQSSPVSRAAALTQEVTNMAGTTVTAALSDDSRLVRKHGTQILAIADYATAVPDEWFAAPDADGVVLPNALPVGFFNMGYITTDGIVLSSDVSSSVVNMVQENTAVRSDIETITDSLAVTFGEASAWTMGLAHGLPCSEWAEDKTEAYEYHGGVVTEFPYYRLMVLTQDGVGKDAFYRVEFAYRAQVSDIGDRTLNRSDAEGVDRTFVCLKDPVVGRSKTTASTGVYAAPAGGGA